MKRWLAWLPGVALASAAAGVLAVALTGQAAPGGDWRTASRARTWLAPEPARTPEAVVQVYSARAFSWRGLFAVHTWVGTKPRGAARWQVYQVLGWLGRWGGDVLSVTSGYPDRQWYGQTPSVLRELRGPAAERVIARIRTLAPRYPWRHRYRLWPGPNSNTFVAWLGRHVPELALDLPPSAIGKDYLPLSAPLAPAPSGTGIQISLAGLASLLVAREEGVELGLLGLGLGVDLSPPALRLPALGRLGAPDNAPAP